MGWQGEEFTANDLVCACERAEHVAEAVETGGLEFHGRPTAVYQDWIDQAETACQKLVEDRKRSIPRCKVNTGAMARIDYKAGGVAEQTWTFIKPRLNAALAPTGAAQTTHKLLALAHGPDFVKVDTKSLQDFANSIAKILHIDEHDVEACPYDIDDPDEGVGASSNPEPDNSLALTIAKLAKALPAACILQEEPELPKLKLDTSPAEPLFDRRPKRPALSSPLKTKHKNQAYGWQHSSMRKICRT